jgi:hypothetical protein
MFQLLIADQEVERMAPVKLGRGNYTQPLGPLEEAEAPHLLLVDHGALEPLVELTLIVVTTKTCTDLPTLAEMLA